MTTGNPAGPNLPALSRKRPTDFNISDGQAGSPPRNVRPTWCGSVTEADKGKRKTAPNGVPGTSLCRNHHPAPRRAAHNGATGLPRGARCGLLSRLRGRPPACHRRGRSPSNQPTSDHADGASAWAAGTPLASQRPRRPGPTEHIVQDRGDSRQPAGPNLPALSRKRPTDFNISDGQAGSPPHNARPTLAVDPRPKPTRATQNPAPSGCRVRHCAGTTIRSRDALRTMALPGSLGERDAVCSPGLPGRPPACHRRGRSPSNQPTSDHADAPTLGRRDALASQRPRRPGPTEHIVQDRGDSRQSRRSPTSPHSLGNAQPTSTSLHPAGWKPTPQCPPNLVWIRDRSRPEQPKTPLHRGAGYVIVLEPPSGAATRFAQWRYRAPSGSAMWSALPATRQAAGVPSAWSQPSQSTHERPRRWCDAGPPGRIGVTAAQKAGAEGRFRRVPRRPVLTEHIVQDRGDSRHLWPVPTSPHSLGNAQPTSTSLTARLEAHPTMPAQPGVDPRPKPTRASGKPRPTACRARDCAGTNSRHRDAMRTMALPGSLGVRDASCSPGYEAGRRRAIGGVAALPVYPERPRRWSDAGADWDAMAPQRTRRPGLRAVPEQRPRRQGPTENMVRDRGDSRNPAGPNLHRTLP